MMASESSKTKSPLMEPTKQITAKLLTSKYALFDDNPVKQEFGYILLNGG